GLIILSTFILVGHVFPFPHLIMVIRSALMFRLRGRLAVTAIAFGLFLTVLVQRIQQSGTRLSSGNSPPPDIWQFSQRMFITFSITFSILFALSLVMILVLMNALMTERESRDQLTHANEQLRNYALRVETLAMEQERNRIAREIHDSLGHSLTALNLQIEGALKLATVRPEQAHRFLQEAKRLGSTALQDVRQSVATLRTDPLNGKTLEEAIATLTEEFYRATRLHPDVQIQLQTEPSMDIATTLYRIVQEALTNIAKHAEANTVAIQLYADGSTLELTITDDGHGFDRSSSKRSGFGLQGMQERVLALSGELQIQSEPGQGCIIRVSLNL
ncbi:MAG: sensor histidine kinase, partial [Merismopedia sp. SIO2A8]|nr:sensor histidine kinase [Merismopedia sp. SIO2A8]